MSNDVLMELILAAIIGALGFAIFMSVSHRTYANGPSAILDNLKLSGQGLRMVIHRSFGRTDLERPKVIVSGPKIKPVVCQICLGRVKAGLEYAKCSCGKEFHPTCLLRTGFCPYCQEPYSSERLAEAFIVRPKIAGIKPAKRTDISMVWQGESAQKCPLCERELPPHSNECVCGAIIVDEGDSFRCPSCGYEVLPQDVECRRCRERFDVVSAPTCFVCGEGVPEGAEECSNCGWVMKDFCPMCGEELGPEDLVCGKCGTTFEIR